MRLRSWNQVSRPVPGGSSHFCGLWEFQLHSGEQTPSHQQTSEEVIVALEGEGSVHLAGETVILKPGEVVWVPSQASHSIENSSSGVLRGLSMEIGEHVAEDEDGHSGEVDAGRLSERDLESLIEAIPNQVDEAMSLSLIIQLFDTAGVLSEQIENAIGLDSDTGLQARPVPRRGWCRSNRGRWGSSARWPPRSQARC